MTETPETPETPTTPEAQPEPTPPAELAVTKLHAELLPWNWRDVDPCLWRFLRAAGFGPMPETDDALILGNTGTLVARATNHGGVTYTFNYYAPGGEGEAPALRMHGGFVLLPQLDGTTQVHVVRYAEAPGDLDVGLVDLWHSAREWMVDQARGMQARPRPVARPRG